MNKNKIAVGGDIDVKTRTTREIGTATQFWGSEFLPAAITNANVSSLVSFIAFCFQIRDYEEKRSLNISEANVHGCCSTFEDCAEISVIRYKIVSTQ